MRHYKWAPCCAQVGDQVHSATSHERTNLLQVALQYDADANHQPPLDPFELLEEEISPMFLYDRSLGSGGKVFGKFMGGD